VAGRAVKARVERVVLGFSMTMLTLVLERALRRLGQR